MVASVFICKADIYNILLKNFSNSKLNKTSSNFMRTILFCGWYAFSLGYETSAKIIRTRLTKWHHAPNIFLTSVHMILILVITKFLITIKLLYLYICSYHCVKSVQIRSYFWSVFSYIPISVFNPNTGKYGPEITPYLDTFHAVIRTDI